MSVEKLTTPFSGNFCCIGLGQIGASFVARHRRVFSKSRMIGCDDANVLQTAREQDLIDDGFHANDWRQAIESADVILLAVPHSVVLNLLPQILERVASHVVVLDCSSVKTSVHALALQSLHGDRFVGLHPMVGSEHHSTSAANAQWLADACVAVTQTKETSYHFVDATLTWLKALGARPLVCSPQEHDENVALVSHLPQIVSSALVNTLATIPEASRLQGPGFRDMTRLAQSSPEMWREIVSANRAAITRALATFTQQLTSLQNSLNDDGSVEKFFRQAQVYKLTLPTVPVGRLFERVSMSKTAAQQQRVAAFKAQGISVAELHIGEPSEPCSPAVQAVYREALMGAPMKYTAVEGIPALRETVASLANVNTGCQYKTENVIVTSGAKQALHLSLAAILAPGDEVIIPRPMWVSFAESVKLAGGRPVFVDLNRKEGFCLDGQKIANAITPQTKAIILNTPHNPTSRVFSQNELSTLIDAAHAHDLWLISDELYRHLVFEGYNHCSPLLMWPNASTRAIFIDGISKSHRMTGLRIGVACGPAEIIKRMAALQSQETTCAVSVSQYVALKLLEKFPQGDPLLPRELSQRRQVFVAWLQKMQYEYGLLSTHLPQGAFYGFIDISRLIHEKTNQSFCVDLLEQQHVAVMPGEAFGAPGFLRMTLAVPQAELERGLLGIEAEFKRH